MSSVQARVALGVKWLDRNKPDWHKHVVIKRLDMGEACSCVLGQVFAKDAKNVPDGFDHVMMNLLPPQLDSEKWSVRHGFDYQPLKSRWNAIEDYEALAAEWTRVIKERRSGRG